MKLSKLIHGLLFALLCALVCHHDLYGEIQPTDWRHAYSLTTANKLSLQDAKDHLQDILGNVSIAEKLKAYRHREGFTQKDLANKADIKQQHISDIERGLRPVGVATAKKLARALNCHYKSLL
jgi:DNA-binding XRE family transcriptional regulator